MGGYRINAFGDQLFGPSADGATTTGYGSAYERILQNDETGWSLGLEFSVPLGRRQALSQVRNVELQLAKARIAYREQELEIGHELADVYREIERMKKLIASARKRHDIAKKRVRAAKVEVELRGSSPQQMDLLLRAEQALVQTEEVLAARLSALAKLLRDWRLRRSS